MMMTTKVHLRKKPKIDYNDDIPEPEPGEDFPSAPSPVKRNTYH